MDAVNRIPGIDVERLSAAYEARVRAALHGAFPAELHLSNRLDPGCWALEWSLPTWLGDAFGLEPEVAHEICLSNVLGLASIRLGDDLVDGELPNTLSGLPTAAVSELLYQDALAVYVRLFAPNSKFWAQLELRMSEWRSATTHSQPPGQLAMRGAPLKISAFAICLLMEREREFAAIARCLDHALAAMVLYDSVIDWRDDLAAGRWNPFVEAAGAQVEVALMTTDVVTTHFRLIGDELDRAAMLASELGVRGLNEHLTQLAAQLDREGGTLAATYRELMDRAQRLLFGNQPSLAA